MNIYEDSACFQQPWPWWRWILTGLNMVALVLSIIMSWHYLTGGSMAGCGGGSPCEQILNSRWSTIMGIIPLSGLAMGVYLAVMVSTFFIGPATEVSVRRLVWSVMLILAGSITGSAIWFTILQKWIIGEFCLYCMSAHITGILLAALILWRARKESDNYSNYLLLTNHSGVRNVSLSAKKYHIRTLPVTGRFLIGLVLAGILSASQVGFTPAAVFSGGESQENMPVIDYNTALMAGSPDAPYIVTLLFDYQCSHCQKIHFMLDEVIRRYDNKLAFVLCPAPLNTQCNPYIPRDADAFKNSCELVRIGLAVRLADREAFPAFQNWMFTFESGDSWYPRDLETARIKAVEMVGESKFDTAWSDPWIGQYMQTCVQIYGQTLRDGRGGIPKMIYGSRWVIPGAYNADDLVLILQKSLALPMPFISNSY